MVPMGARMLMRLNIQVIGVAAGLTSLMSGAQAWAAETPAGPGEVAKVNGQTITMKDIESALGGLNEGQRANVLKDPNSRRQILVNLIDQEVLAQQGAKEKMDQDPEFKVAMDAFRKQYLASRVLQKNLGAKLTEKAAKSYYDKHKRDYSTDQVQVQHILTNDEAQAMDVMKKAKAPNADFQELAEKLSKDPSAKNNRGDVGVINRDSPFVKEFKDAAFDADEGEIVGPIKTTYGYHVIKVLKKKVGKPLEYHEVEMRVKNDLREELMKAYVSNLKKTAKISVNDKAID